MIAPDSISDLSELVRSSSQPLLAVGGGTKSGLCNSAEAESVRMCGLAGILEYEPTEYTFTARAGTPLKLVQEALAQHGQYLPCDPLLVDAGSTLGGMIAAAAQGPGRVRYGGVRDFVVGVQFIDGTGTLRRGGGKVVKNAAGFDFPKLLCGSLGRLGILTEVTCKVFPRSLGSMTFELRSESLAETLSSLTVAANQTWELEALEIDPPHRLVLRLCGAPEAMESRRATIMKRFPNLLEFDGAAEWNSLREFSWAPSDAPLVKVPLLLQNIPALHQALGAAPHRFSQAANVAWIAWKGEQQELHEILRQQNLTGLVWRGAPAYLGQPEETVVAKLVKHALDPQGRFPSFPNFPA